jgi:hypothetical protein
LVVIGADCPPWWEFPQTLREAESLTFVGNGRLAAYEVIPISGPLSRWLGPVLRSGHFDEVHAYGLEAATHAALARGGLRVPLHVTLPEPITPAQYPHLWKQAKRWWHGRALAQSQTITTIGNDARVLLMQTFPNLRRHLTKIHALSFRLEKFSRTSENLRERLHLDEATLLLGTCASMDCPRLLGALLRVEKFGDTRDFHLVTLTSDEESLIEQLDLLIIPKVEARAWRSALLARLHSVPILAINAPVLREVLRNAKTEFYASGEVCALEVALRRCLS